MLAHLDPDGPAGVLHGEAAHQAFGGLQGDAAHGVLQVLADLRRHLPFAVHHKEQGVDGRHLPVGKADIQHRSNDADDSSIGHRLAPWSGLPEMISAISWVI
ncbi:hypothetical protein SDC9_195620 [bioreactor metagenome]|uniref:Uncharacterized protein n=1 Tax=bioreactor metagenome TaxID=1076179 RepID=A0A645IAS6_9ZZZZ